MDDPASNVRGRGPQKTLPQTRLESIDFLRGVAALAVVLYHALTFAKYESIDSPWFRGIAGVLRHGYLGVPLFFVISGFCIHLRWSQRHKETGAGGIDFVSFWKRRIYRLYPAYFVVLCLSMAMVVAAYLANMTPWVVSLYPEPKPRWMALDFIVHATMLHGLHPLFDIAGGNPPLWSLAREEYLYLMYFGLLAIRRRRTIVVAASISFGVGFLFFVVMLKTLGGESFWWPVVRTSAVALWIQWSLGAVAVEALYGLVRLPRWCYGLGWALLWAITAQWSRAHFSALEPLGWGMVFFTLVNCCVRSETEGRWPKARVVRWLSSVGVFSYSLYLVHYPVRALVKLVLGSYAATTNPWLYLGCMALIAIAGYWAARAFFALVESRFLGRSTRGGAWPVAPVADRLAPARGTME